MLVVGLVTGTLIVEDVEDVEEVVSVGIGASSARSA